MTQLPGEPEPSPQVFTCPTCPADQRLVMVSLETVNLRNKLRLRKQGKKVEELHLILSLNRRQAEQLLAGFRETAQP